MCGVAGDLVAETLRGDDGNLIADALVRLEVEGELGVVALNDDLGGLLDSLVWVLGFFVLSRLMLKCHMPWYERDPFLRCLATRLVIVGCCG